MAWYNRENPGVQKVLISSCVGISGWSHKLFSAGGHIFWKIDVLQFQGWGEATHFKLPDKIAFPVKQ